MWINNVELLRRLMASLRRTRLGGLFLDKKFFHYTWIGIFISVLNIVLLWFFIDILRIPTVVASTMIIGVTFIIRYFLFRQFEAI